MGDRMPYGRMGIGLLVAVMHVGIAQADTPESPAAPVAATEEACQAACGASIAQCVGTFGPAMGDMRPFCSRAVLRRCRSGGVKVCTDTETPPPASR
jgi:hypothetical protein